MITEFFLNIVFTLVSGMLELMPDITWSVDTSSFSFFLDIIRIVGYMFPIDTIVHIIGIIVDLTLVRIALAIPKSIWDLLPFA